MKLKTMIVAAIGCLLTANLNAQSVRETIQLDKGWRFALGNAADPQKDFGCGTEYFNYLTKASSIHNEGPYTEKFKEDDRWHEVQLPHYRLSPWRQSYAEERAYRQVSV